MSGDKGRTDGPENLFSSWLKAGSDFWNPTGIWPGSGGGYFPFPVTQSAEAAQAADLWRSLHETWGMFFSIAGSGSAAGNLPPAALLPELIMKIAQPFWAGYFLLQQGGEEKAKQKQEFVSNLGEIARSITKAWCGMYEKELNQFLNVPQLGLTRFYQERVTRTMEKFNRFQAELSEFVHIFYMPLERTFQTLQEEIPRMERKGEDILEESKGLYQAWVKNLEESYNGLLRSPDYLQSLEKTLKALQDFRKTRQQFMIDLLQDLPIPTNKEMDELYKEIYFLKKRVSELEKKVKP
jgi:polyhydroxyalkanoate synthesis regulator phasin